MKQIKIFILFGLLLGTIHATEAQELQPRIAGLESDSLYMALLKENRQIERLLDSIGTETERIRERYQKEPDQRKQHEKTLLSLEIQQLTLGKSKRESNELLTSIEQVWILKTMNRQPAVTNQPTRIEQHDHTSGPSSSNLIENSCFRTELEAEDYALLVKVQQQESEAAPLIERFTKNYSRLEQLQQAQEVTTEQTEADSIFHTMSNLTAENQRINDSLRGIWSTIFDHKGYAYAYLLDRTNHSTLQGEQIARLDEARRSVDMLKGSYASDALMTYVIEKRALLACEDALAGKFELQAARDSLQQAIKHLAGMEYRLPRIEPRHRYLIDYTSVDFPKKISYSTYKVPACKVYSGGTIYRILLMDSKYRQKADIFRGVEPLYLLQEGGRHLYFTGGFATLSEARKACDLLRKKGFRQPLIVRWVDGERSEVSETEGKSLFRIEITTTGTLSDQVNELIHRMAPNHELVRAGSTFLIGGFEEQSTAEELANEIRRTDGDLQITIHEE